MKYDATFEWDELGNRPCLLAKAWTRSATAAEDHARAMASVIRAAKRVAARRRAHYAAVDAYRVYVDGRTLLDPFEADLEALKASPEWAAWDATHDALRRAGKSLDVAVARLEKLERKKGGKR